MNKAVNIEESTYNQRNLLTKNNTFNLAASIIANADFPNKNHLPKTTPRPFTNFGNQPLINHELLQTILWSVIDRLQGILKPWKKQNILLRIFVTFLAVGIYVFSVANFRNAEPGILLSIFVLVIGNTLILKRKQKYIDRFAAAKATELQRLLDKNWQESHDDKLTSKISERVNQIGTGELCENQIPVLTIVDEQDPFPGYGRMQLEKTFICRPKEETAEQRRTESEVAESVFKNVQKMVNLSQIAEASSGTVITLNGDSLTIDSQWLEENKAPLLSIPAKKLNKFLNQGDFASSRAYHAIQLVFPKYNTASTFFLRTFLAGNSASCHLALTTIGPPILNKQHLEKILLKYRLENEMKNKRARVMLADRRPLISKIKKPHELLSSIWAIRKVTADADNFIAPNINLKSILKLNIEQETLAKNSDQREYDKEFNRIVNQSTMWPGNIVVPNLNVRDGNSYAFAADFYGKQEMKACLKTLYDQVSRAILDTFDELGFTISDYRDKEGNYLINAEKIDSLVIGEKIQITKKETSKSDSKKLRKTI